MISNPSGGAGLTQGTAAAKPATPNAGQIYFATDTGELWLGNAAGNAWQSIAQTSAGLFLARTAGNVGLSVGYNAGSGAPALRNTNTGLEIEGVANGWSVGGNLDIVNAGNGLQVKEGSNAKQGTGTLTAGSAVVANTSVTANSRIFVTSNADGGTPGFLRVSARTAGTSFTVTSSSGTDTSTFAYEIFEPG